MGWLQCDFWTFHGMSVPPTETAAFHPVQTSSQTVYQPWLLETSSRNEWSNRQIKNTHFPKRNWVLESRSQWFESMSDSGYIQEIPYFHYKVGGLRGMPSGELQDCPVSSPKGLVVGLSRVQGNANMQQVQAHSDVPWSHSQLVLAQPLSGPLSVKLIFFAFSLVATKGWVEKISPFAEAWTEHPCLFPIRRNVNRKKREMVVRATQQRKVTELQASTSINHDMYWNGNCCGNPC